VNRKSPGERSKECLFFRGKVKKGKKSRGKTSRLSKKLKNDQLRKGLKKKGG